MQNPIYLDHLTWNDPISSKSLKVLVNTTLPMNFCVRLNLYVSVTNKWVILCQLSQPVNPPPQIFLIFHKQIELLMLIPKN